jgi:general secretion pathway protein I
VKPESVTPSHLHLPGTPYVRAFSGEETVRRRTSGEQVCSGESGAQLRHSARYGVPASRIQVRGFTLLEVMIALAIMAGVLFTVIGSFNHHLDIVARDREETIAVLLARSKLDDPAVKEQAESKGTFAPDWPGIAWESATTSTDLPGVNRLTLTVSWDNARRTLALVRYLAK